MIEKAQPAATYKFWRADNLWLTLHGVGNDLFFLLLLIFCHLSNSQDVGDWVFSYARRVRAFRIKQPKLTQHIVVAIVPSMPVRCDRVAILSNSSAATFPGTIQWKPGVSLNKTSSGPYSFFYWILSNTDSILF